MRSGNYNCGARLFFHNTRCLACGMDVGICSGCREFVTIDTSMPKPSITCRSCEALLSTCDNRIKCGCNGTVLDSNVGSICDWCSLSTVVPDLSDVENAKHWATLETAKRRLLYQLELIGFPPYCARKMEVPLTFRFLSDYLEADGTTTRVFTGHENGVITVNLKEADSVYREQVRVELKEPQRTLIGHLRHEYGHYLDLCIPRSSRNQYIELFGDPEQNAYSESLTKYYDLGPPPDWRNHHVSAYATMHPWEDFAETVNLYLDMQAIVSTARDSGWLARDVSGPHIAIGELVRESLKIAVAVSELNGDLGLPTLLPENIQAPVLAKLTYIHGLSDAFATAGEASSKALV